MFDRVQHFFNTIQTNWSSDPAARGAAKMTAGAGASQGFFADLFALAGKARNGEVKIEETAAGIPGASQGH